MKTKLAIVALLCGLTVNSYANLTAEPNSTQYVTIINNLANPKMPVLARSTIEAIYYDGANSCWVERGISSEPNIAGAGGGNACGRGNAGIIKVDIKVNPSIYGNEQVYQNLPNIIINPEKLNTVVLVEQDTAPVFSTDGSGTLVSQGTLKIEQLTE
jgi:hypothetical protein